MRPYIPASSIHHLTGLTLQPPSRLTALSRLTIPRSNGRKVETSATTRRVPLRSFAYFP
ncbi:hypothetical protein K523DRAFT_324360 [Schizophyllum commune Tattone D]|nr:hypothetical protein K523DRAFT_324360 [Schizophyllum commune Tattone D]